MEIDLRDVYKRGLKRADAGQVATSLLERVIAGDDKGVNFEESVRSDAFVTTAILKTASEALKKGEVRDLSHAVVLLGQDIVRNFILGQTVLRSVDTNSDREFKSLDQTLSYLARGKEAEELAQKNGYDHPGLAMATGFLFDVLEQWIKKDPNLEGKFSSFFEITWRHCARTAALAWAFGNHPKINIKLKKHIFPGGMLHDIGKLFMAALYPTEYFPLLEKYKSSQETSMYDDATELEIERTQFGTTHAELGSLLVYSTRYLRDYEALVDFHHDSPVLKARDGDLFLASIIINLADRVSFLMDIRSNLDLDDLRKVIDPLKANLPLLPQDVQTVVTSLRSKGAMP